VYFAFLFVHAVCAQTANATLTGKVTAAGAGLPKAAVTVTEANTGASRKVLTGPDGTFSVSGLAPGTYRIEVDTPGYRRGILERYELAAAPSAPLEVTLERGSSTDPTQVRVESETPMVQSDSAEVAQVHSTKMVSELPVADRNREQLVELMPGITPPAPAVSPLLDAQGSRSYNTHGQLSMANHRSLDGTENQEPFFGLTLHAVPNEFVRQARIVTANENAALGRLGGAQESVTTCLGTNNIHGSLFEFNSCNWLRARNVFKGCSCGNRRPSSPRFRPLRFAPATSPRPRI